MTDTNPSIKKLSFSGKNIDAFLVKAGSNYVISGEAIVINLSDQIVAFHDEIGAVRPWRSTILRNIEIQCKTMTCIIQVKETDNIGKLLLDESWRPLGALLPKESEFPKDTPLWISAQEEIGDVETDVLHFIGQTSLSQKRKQFTLKLNLWYAPPFTDCYIHTGHPFLEVHTQVHGQGRMQKFSEQKVETKIEEVYMLPGFTHESFALALDESWRYPWHRYYADTDCIWLAIELHLKN